MTQAVPVSLARQPLCDEVLRDTYAQPGESGVADVRERIARALAERETPAARAGWAARFVALQQAGFMPAGRIAAHAGTPRPMMMFSCFVQPLGDGSAPAVERALDETVCTLASGGGVGLDFSPVPPAGDGVGARAGGPVGCLHRFDAAAQALESAAPRRAAMMGVLRCDHPDVLRFVRAKADGGLSHFNLSVAVTDAFLRAAEAGGAAGAEGAAARTLWRQIVHAAHATGEPGLLFIDRINADNNLGDRETIAATNPCGEAPLPPYGACCLGSFDLTALVEQPFTPGARLALERLAALVPVAVRLLDNVLDLSDWPLPQQRAQAMATRRMGLGFSGLGDALATLGLHYDSDAGRTLAAAVARCLRDAAYAASLALACERGPFPEFRADGLLRAGSCAARLPAALQHALRCHGLRNSHLLAVAPAGSVSLAFADNVSSGIEPPYAWRVVRERLARDGSGLRTYEVEDHAWRLFRAMAGPHRVLPPAFVSAAQLSPQAHLAMVAAVAPFIDGAISKTVNLPDDCTADAFDDVFRSAWRLGLKGVTAFRRNRVLGAVLAPARARGGCSPGAR